MPPKQLQPGAIRTAIGWINPNERIEILARALAHSARTHHLVARMRENDMHMSNYNWQHCRSHSCTEAFSAMVEAGIYGTKHIEIRKRMIKKFEERMKKE